MVDREASCFLSCVRVRCPPPATHTRTHTHHSPPRGTPKFAQQNADVTVMSDAQEMTRDKLFLVELPTFRQRFRSCALFRFVCPFPPSTYVNFRGSAVFRKITENICECLQKCLVAGCGGECSTTLVLTSAYRSTHEFKITSYKSNCNLLHFFHQKCTFTPPVPQFPPPPQQMRSRKEKFQFHLHCSLPAILAPLRSRPHKTTGVLKFTPLLWKLHQNSTPL